MGSLQNIVNVQISRQTSVPTRAGFGTGAFVASDAVFGTPTKSYSSLQEVTDDSFAGSQALAAASAYFGQQISPPKLTIIKRSLADVNQVATLTFSEDLVTGNTITPAVDGVDLTPVPFNSDNATTLDDIATEIQGDAAVTTAVSDGTDTITITYADLLSHTTSAVVAGGASQATASFAITTYPQETATLSEALAAAVDYDNDWYGLGIYSRVDADILEVAGWVQGQGSTNPKIFFAQSDETDILDVGNSADIASQLQAAAYFRTSIWYHALDAEYLEMALMGGQLPTDPGSITWAYKTLSGITVDDLTDSQKNAADGKAANTYDTVAGVNITEQGKVSDSPFEWIDVIRGVDWLSINIAADLFELLLQLPKLPYDTNGIGVVKSTVLNRLYLGQSQGILTLDQDPVVTVPDVANIPAADKANRVLNNVEFSGVLAGAIQKINVAGTVSLV